MPVLRAETNTLKIVKICVCRFVPVLTYNVNYNATENLRMLILPRFLGVKCSIRLLSFGGVARCLI